MLAGKTWVAEKRHQATLAARLNGVPPEARGDCPELEPKDITDMEAGPEERSNSAANPGTDQDDVGATSLIKSVVYTL